MGATCPTFGMVPFAKFSLTDPQVLIATGLLAGTLFVGAIAIALIDRWRKRIQNETYSAHEQLASFRLLYERGDLSAEEFERVRKQLLGRLKHEGTAPKPAPKTPAPSTAVTETLPAALPPASLPPDTETGSSQT
jgi:hypothetical protein